MSARAETNRIPAAPPARCPLQRRHALPIAGIAVLLLIGLVYVLSLDGGTSPPIGAPGPTDPGTADVEQVGDNRVANDVRATDPSTAPTGEERLVSPHADSPPKSGMIDGRIVLAAGLPHAIDGYTVLFEEAINPNAPPRDPARKPRAWRRGFKADPGISPLFFTERDVEFSEYGYRVTVFVPGVNGSDQYVRCDVSHPYSEVSLTLTPGCPFSLRLIDQFRNPVAGHRVALRPKGWPDGRPFVERTSDTFGVSVFESLLAGVWEVLVDDTPEGEITVAPPGVVNDEAALGVQSAVLTIPLGKPLRIETFDGAGHGLVDVDLTLVLTDTTENRRYTAKSDATGCWTFPNITPGRWQLTASGGGSYSPTTRTIEIQKDVDPEPVRVRLIRSH